MGTLKWGLRVLVGSCPHLPSIVISFATKIPFPKGLKRPQMCRTTSRARQDSKPQNARTAPKHFLNSWRALSNQTSQARVLRQIAPESSPESSANSLSHKFFGVPVLALVTHSTAICDSIAAIPRIAPYSGEGSCDTPPPQDPPLPTPPQHNIAIPPKRGV